MSPLELVLLVALHIRVSVFGKELYSRPGSDVVLSCGRASDVDPTCFSIQWLYSRNRQYSVTEVQGGRVQSKSSRAARLKLSPNCSLVISNITAEDIGQYVCRYRGYQITDVVTLLGVLTISLSPADADPKLNSEVTLQCSVLRHIDLRPCAYNSIQWLDETGNVLPPGEGVDYEFLRQTGCESFLIVKRQSGRRRFTCRFVDERNIVKTEADYTLNFNLDGRKCDETEPSTPTPPPGSNVLYIIIGVAVGVVVMLVIIIIIIFIKHSKRAKMAAAQENRAKYHQKPTEQPATEMSCDARTSENPVEEEPDSTLTYATVMHPKQWTSPNRKVQKEEVTYSMIKTSVEAEMDS